MHDNYSYNDTPSERIQPYSDYKHSDNNNMVRTTTHSDCSSLCTQHNSSSSLVEPLASLITKSMYNYHQLYTWFTTYIDAIIIQSHKKIVSLNHHDYVALHVGSRTLQTTHHLDLQKKRYDKNSILAQFAILFRIKCKVWFESNQIEVTRKTMIRIKITV